MHPDRGLNSPTIAALILLAAAPFLHAQRTWNLKRTEQLGQRTFYNARINGGIFGLPVETGDFDGDGHTDFVIAPMALDTGPGEGRMNAGEVYIYRGDGNIDGILDRAALSREEIPGLTLIGARTDDMLGNEIATGDFNGDGIDDLVIGSQNHDGPGLDRPMAGAAFVLLGRPGLLEDGSIIDILELSGVNPPSGVVTVLGERSGDRLGLWVASGDLDGDGFDDVLLGADQSPGGQPDPEMHPRVGMAAVIYGRSSFLPFIDLANGPESLPGLAFLYGRDSEDHFGSTVYANDLDGDGRDELMVASALSRLSAGQPDRVPNAQIPAVGSGGGKGPDEMFVNMGEVAILFSSASDDDRLPPRIDLAPNATLPEGIAERLTIVYGAIPNSVTGEEIATADVNGDGDAELILGALGATNENGEFGAGAVYVIYGANELRGADLDLASPDPGLSESLFVSVFFGSDRQAILGDTIVTGDFDADGFDDLAIGVPYSNPDIDFPGFVRVAFGRPSHFPELTFPFSGTLDGDPSILSIVGADPYDKLAYSMAVADVDKDGHDDLFINAMHGRGASNRVPSVGEAYLVSGARLVAPIFIRGDSTGDGRLDITDPVATLTYLFVGGDSRCLDSHDSNDSGELEISDAVRTLNYLFLGGEPPAPPFPEAGLDPTEDELGC